MLRATLLAAALLWAMLGAALAQAPGPVIGNQPICPGASQICQPQTVAQTPVGPACGGYVGPGDVDANWTHWYGLRAYSAATCGAALISVYRNDAGTGTCNGVASQTTCSIKSLTTNGKLDEADLTTFCSGSTCAAQTVFDQVGSINVGNQGSTSQSAAVTASCVNTTYSCLTGSGTTKLVGSANLTVPNGNIIYTAAKQTHTTSGNRDILVGQALFNSSIGWSTTDHMDCLEGGSGEIIGTVALGTWIRGFCTINAGSSALLENGTNHTGTLTSGSSSQTFYVMNNTTGGSTATWVEGGINSTLMGSTLSTMDSNVSAYWGI